MYLMHMDLVWCACEASYQLTNSILLAAVSGLLAAIGATAAADDAEAVEFVAVVVAAAYQFNSAKTDNNSTGPKR